MRTFRFLMMHRMYLRAQSAQSHTAVWAVLSRMLHIRSHKVVTGRSHHGHCKVTSCDTNRNSVRPTLSGKMSGALRGNKAAFTVFVSIMIGGHTIWVIYPRTCYMPVQTQNRPILRLSTARNSPLVPVLTIYLTHFTPFHPWKVRLSVIGRGNQHPSQGRLPMKG